MNTIDFGPGIPIREGCLPTGIVETTCDLPWYARVLTKKPKTEIVESISMRTIEALSEKGVRDAFQVHIPVEKIGYLEHKTKEAIFSLVHAALHKRCSFHTLFPHMESYQDPRQLTEKTCLGGLNVHYSHPDKLTVFLWLNKGTEHNIRQVVVPLVSPSDI